MSAEKIIGVVIVVIIAAVGFVAYSILNVEDAGDIEPIEQVTKKDVEGEALADIPDPVEKENGSSALTREKVAPRKTTPVEAEGAGGVTGRVLNHKKRPVQGARVALCSSMGFFMAFPTTQNELGVEDVTDSQGNYRLSGLEPGREYSLLVSHTDYADTTKSPVRVQAGTEIELADLIMNEGLVVKGTVTDKAGAPVPGATVRLLDQMSQPFFSQSAFSQNPGKKVLKETTVDASGTYSFESVSSHLFTVEASAEGYGSQSKQQTQFDAKRLNEIDFVLGVGQTMSGLVTDMEDRPVEGAFVTANKSRVKKFFSTGSAVTGSDGRFEIVGLAKGNYVIRATCEGFTPKGKQKIQIGASTVVIKLQRQGSVAGFVLDQKTGKPVKNFSVEVFRDRPGKPQFATGVSQAFQSADGAFQIDNVDPGSYVIQVVAAGYAKCSSDAFRVDRGKVIEGVEVFLNEGGVLRGRVFDSHGKPLKGAEITLRFNKFVDVDIFGFMSQGGVGGGQGDSGLRTVTDGKGNFEKSLITPGTYQVYFRHHGHTSMALDDITVFEGKAAAVDLGTVRMTAGGTIKGKTLDSGGMSMPGAVVVLSRDNGFQKQVISDKDARFEFEHLEPGQYSVTIQSDPMGGAAEEDFNIFSQLFAAEKSKVNVNLAEGRVETIVIRLVP
jgi:protocatechuate 3,4-dioxygenase beta subunit